MFEDDFLVFYIFFYDQKSPKTQSYICKSE